MKKIICLFGLYALLFSQGKREGFPLLRVSLGARAAGLGESFTAIMKDGFSAFWNPAGISTLERSQILLSHNENFLQIRDEYAGLVFLSKYGSFSSYFVYSSISDIELRDENDNLIPNEATQVSYILGIGYGYRWNSLSAGITGKYLYDRMREVKGQGIALDIGVLHRTTQNFSIGACLKNLGPPINYSESKFPIPFLFRIGTYLSPVEPLNLIMDAEYNRQDGFNFYAGAEGKIMEILALRMGYRTVQQENHFTFGAGVGVKQFHIDYAFMPYSILGNTHKISLSLDFGQPTTVQTSLKIKVMNGKTGLPISTPIKMRGVLKKEVETDPEGLFYQKNISPGRLIIEISHPDFYPKTEELTVKRGEDNLWTIILTPLPLISLTGKIIDEITGEPLVGKIIFRGTDYGEMASKEQGFKIEGISPGNYEFEVIPEDTFYKALYLTRKIKDRDTVIFGLKGREVELRTIYFETASAEISLEYFPFLNRLGEYLTHRPWVKVVLSGHTDIRDIRDIYPSNLVLSAERAKSVRNYLIENFGIDKSRITIKSFGAKKPVLPNTSPENMAKNRRVTVLLE